MHKKEMTIEEKRMGVLIRISLLLVDFTFKCLETHE